MRRFLLPILAGVLAFASTAMPESIYAPLGVGMTLRQGSVRAISLGGADGALTDSIYYPLTNPAGWFNNGYTRFTASFYGYKVTAIESGSRDATDDFTFPNMAVAIPLYRSLGLGISYSGLTDYEFLAYRDESNTPDGSDSTYSYRKRFQGSGGLGRFQIDLGARIMPWLAVGAGIDIYYGKTEQLWTLTFNQGTFYRSGEFIRHEFSGSGLRLGAIADLGNSINLAGTIKLPTALRVYSTLKVEGGDSTSLPSSTYDLPAGFGLAGSWTHGRLRTVAQGNMDLWTTPTSGIGSTDSYSTAWDGGVGVERLPLRGPLDPWYQKWIYRAGIRYTQHYVDVNGNPLHILGVSLGLGIPIKTHPGILDFALTYDLRGSESANIAVERVIGVRFGFASAEKWFVRRHR